MKWFIAAICLTIVVLFTGCTELTRTTTTTTTTTNTTSTSIRTIGGSLEVTVYIDKGIYDLGEEVEINFRIKNTGTGTFERACPNIQQFYFVIMKGIGSASIWTFPQIVSPAVSTFTLAPGETLTETGTWTQVDNNGDPVSAGDYMLTGMLGSFSSDIYSICDFTIH